jgi:hypothetical protein
MEMQEAQAAQPLLDQFFQLLGEDKEPALTAAGATVAAAAVAGLVARVQQISEDCQVLAPSAALAVKITTILVAAALAG